jgi:hypothetical protein
MTGLATVEWAGADMVLFAADGSSLGSQAMLFAVQRDGTGQTSLVELGKLFPDFDWHS